MSFLENRKLNLLGIVAAVFGIGSFSFPLLAPWHLFLVVGLAIVAVGIVNSPVARFVAIAINVAVIAAVSGGHIASPFAAGILASCVLLVCERYRLASAVLALHLSISATAVQLTGEILHSWHLELAGPALIAIAAITLTDHSYILKAALFAFLAVAFAYVGNYYFSSPESALAFASLPACAFGVWAAVSEHRQSFLKSAGILAPVLLVLVLWAVVPPRNWTGMYLLLPTDRDAPEAVFFEKLDAALSMSGKSVIHAADPGDIPDGALVLLPWLTAPFVTSGDESAFLMRFARLARERRWTIIAAAEHGNLGNGASRIEAMTGLRLVRSDLTVPRGNLDSSGPLHTLGISDWPLDAILNRGASVRVGNWTDRILLAGDGWWAEPDIGEWLWVGDYVWQPKDRSGRIALAVASETNGARWIVVGDTSLFLNLHLAADPRPFLRLVESASLWPALARDVLLVSFILVIILWVPKSESNMLLISLGPIAILLGAAGIALAIQSPGSQKWRSIYVGESGFDNRNFNTAILEHPELTLGHDMRRSPKEVRGSVELPAGRTVLFTLVKDEVRIGDVRFYSCRRLGSLRTTEGPFLMDAQTCKIEGQAEVLIGNENGAAAIRIREGTRELLVVLDSAFLARKAPKANSEWLLKTLRQ